MNTDSDKVVVTINVTQAHIEAGERDDCSRCPVARASWEVLSVVAKVDGVKVYGTSTLSCSVIELTYAKYHADVPYHAEVNVPLPRDVSEMVEHYDSTGEMEPFAFEVEIPSHLTNRPNEGKG